MTAISPHIPVVRKPKLAPFASDSTVEVAVGAETATEPNYRSIYLSTILAVSLVFLFGVGIPAAAAYGNAAGWGLGAFCAFWGGPSFGVMAGSARVSAWFEAHEEH